MAKRAKRVPVKNPNLRFAAIFVDGLSRSGLSAVVVSPGSRSTPLTLAFDAHPHIETFVHLDERGAGFFALGMAIASDRPVALVCTSGTAAANYFPAIIEAQMSQVPLLVLTSDRPHELRHSGSNQTIDQVKLFGNQVLWSVDMPLPETDPPQAALRNVASTAVRAYATANGLRKGPVHVNFPFRKPLEPKEDEIRDWRLGSETTSSISSISSLQPLVSHGHIFPTAEQLDWLTAVVRQHRRGLIICGPRCPGGDFPQAVRKLAQHLGYPILADAISGLRFQRKEAKRGKGAKEDNNIIISGYETFLQGEPGWPEPEIIVRFGAVPTSKWLNAYLDKIKPGLRLHIRENGVWADDSHRTSHFLQLNETAVCRQLVQNLSQRENEAWVTAARQAEQTCWAALNDALADKFFDGAIVRDIVDLIPAGAALFMGNSSPIRHLDQYGRAQNKKITAYANRGASGIDGNLATALGILTAGDQPLVAVVGDITFFHDMNSLLIVKYLLQRNDATKKEEISEPSAALQATGNITIVLLHNDGGGIFNRLPIGQIEPPFTRLFLTPHGLDFEPVCRMFGLDYVRADSREAFLTAFAASVQDDTPRLIAVHTQNHQDETMRREINKTVLAKLKR